MFAVLFEVEPFQARRDEYLQVASLLRPDLESIDGFIDNHRFTSAEASGRVLSLSTWRDEKSLIRWRTHVNHYEKGQLAGRSDIFADYRLRVAEVVSDTHPPAHLTMRQSRYDETEVSEAKAATVIEPTGAAETTFAVDFDHPGGLLSVQRYDMITPPHTPLVLASWTDTEAAAAGTPTTDGLRIRHLRVIREYGRNARQEAPQYLPPVM